MNNTNHKVTIAITGGHLSPAITTIQALLKDNSTIIFFGRKQTFTEKKEPSLEYQLLGNKENLIFYELSNSRFKNKNVLEKIISTFPIFIGICQAAFLLKKHRVKKIISFGGYLSVPVCLAGFFLKIPIYIHEQTVSPGLANNFLGFFAKKIFLTFPESKVNFSSKKTVLIGNPMLERLQIKKRPEWHKMDNKPIVLVIGGSSGSHSINLLIEKFISELTNKFLVIHQTGDNQFNDFERLINKERVGYKVIKFLSPYELNYFYEKASLLVCRTGANTFFEIIYNQIPAVLIPLPWSSNNEQLLQAKILEKNNVARIFFQDKPATSFLETVYDVYNQKVFLKENFKNLTNYAKLIISGKQFIEKLED